MDGRLRGSVAWGAKVKRNKVIWWIIARNATATITATTAATVTPTHSPCDFIKESNDVISAAQHIFLQVSALHCECVLCGRLLFDDLLTCLPVSLSVPQFGLEKLKIVIDRMQGV
jgi:hypothetical protein